MKSPMHDYTENELTDKGYKDNGLIDRIIFVYPSSQEISDSGKRKSGSMDALPGGRRTASRLPSSGKTAVFGKAEPGRGKAGR